MRIRAVAVLAAAALGGCSTQESYKQAFSTSEIVEGSSQVIDADKFTVWPVAMSVLARQGFTISQADEPNGVVSAKKEMIDPNDEELSYEITATVTVEPDLKRHSTVTLAANEQTVLHRKSLEWFHLFWLIPLFPIGSEYQTVIRNEQTVRDPQFYADFFDAVNSALDRPKPRALQGAPGRGTLASTIWRVGVPRQRQSIALTCPQADSSRQ